MPARLALPVSPMLLAPEPEDEPLFFWLVPATTRLRTMAEPFFDSPAALDTDFLG
jgi:hypothetical protein